MSRRNAKVNTKYRATVKRLEDEFRRLYDNIPIAMWRASLSDGKFLRANVSCAKLLGFPTAEQLTGRTWSASKSSTYADFIANVKRDKAVYNFELPYQKDDGTQLVLSLTAKLCEPDGYIEGSMYDVTSRRLECHQEEQQLREIEYLQDIKSQIKDRLASGI